MITYFTDTDCDVTLVEAKKYGFKLISMPYSIGDKTVYPYEDFEVFDSKTFYDTLRSGVLPTTSAVLKDKYIEYFEPEFAAGNDICYFHFSEAMSSSFGFMRLALEDLKVKYPERKFYDVDLNGISVNAYYLVLELGDMILAGKSVDELVAYAKAEQSHVATYFFANDLKFFRRSGRVGGLRATMGTIVGIRPIMFMNDEGKLVQVGKEVGKEKAISRLVQYMQDLGDNIKEHRVIIAHADCKDDADRIIQKAKAKFGDDLKIDVIDVNPTAGSHCGPSSIGIAFHAIHR